MNTAPANVHEGHGWVDLGLSVKWATCNIGASCPEEYGDYFAWGETRPKSEFEELVENCTWTWTTQNGHKGYKVTSKKNGQSIFLPAAGYRYVDELCLGGEFGYYWSSTSFEGNAGSAYDLYFYEGYQFVNWLGRNRGRSVRPVLED